MAKRVFIVRHGEREDWADHTWARTAERPHDPSLTKKGIHMARRLGQYLLCGGQGWNEQLVNGAVDPSDCVLFTSPLVRCVQTTHAIAEGLGHSLPIHVEDSLVEGLSWIYNDLARQPHLAAKPLQMTPLWHPADHHATSTSPLVVPNHPSFFTPEPVVASWGALSERIPCLERCRVGAEHLFNSPMVVGKTVILVGHGETTAGWYTALTGLPYDDLPHYTAFAQLLPNNAVEEDEDSVAVKRDAVVAKSDGKVQSPPGPYCVHGHTFVAPHLERHAM